VTDNASNFNKAFVTFTAVTNKEPHDGTDEEFQDGLDDADSEGVSEDDESVDITTILSSPEESESDSYLPPHPFLQFLCHFNRKEILHAI